MSHLAVGIEAESLIRAGTTRWVGTGRPGRGRSVRVEAQPLFPLEGNLSGLDPAAPGPTPEGGEALGPDVLEPEPGAFGRAEAAGLRGCGAGRGEDGGEDSHDEAASKHGIGHIGLSLHRGAGRTSMVRRSAD